MPSTRVFVLVHGGGHKAACWDSLVEGLARIGCRASTIDLPGHGRDPAADPEPRNLDHGIAAVVSHLRAIDAPVVLVGHSLGGMTISGVAEAVPDRIERLVYLSAFLPADGQSAGDISEQVGFNPDDLGYLTEDGMQIAVRLDRAHEVFYHDCGEDVSRKAVAALCNTDIGYLVTPVRLTEGRFGRLPKTFVACLSDKAIDIGVQRKMIGSGGDIDVEELPSSHSPFLSMPDRLAELLNRL